MAESGTAERRWNIAAIICLGIAVYFLVTATFALVNGKEFASEWPQFIRYVAIPVLIAIGLIICAWFAKPDTRNMVAGSGLAILGGMFAFELVMTARSYSAMAGLVSLPDIQWIRAHDADESLPPSRTAKSLNTQIGVTSLKDAVLGGIPDKRVYLCTNAEKPVFYQADQLGFNNPAQSYDQPPEVMVIGDSFVEGICLEPGRDLVGQLRRDTPAIGIGNRGAGPLFALAALGRYGPQLRPRTVVFAFFEGNDWENLAAELQTPYLRQALSPDAEFGAIKPAASTLARAKPVIAAWQATTMPGPLEVMRRTEGLRNLFALQKTALNLGIAYPKAPPPIPEFADVLARAKDIAAGWGGRVILLYIPLQDRYLGLINRDFVYDQLRSKVLSAAERNRITVVDLAPVFGSQQRPERLYASDAHFSEQGAGLAASIVAQYLRRTPKSDFAGNEAGERHPGSPQL